MFVFQLLVCREHAYRRLCLKLCHCIYFHDTTHTVGLFCFVASLIKKTY